MWTSFHEHRLKLLIDETVNKRTEYYKFTPSSIFVRISVSGICTRPNTLYKACPCLVNQCNETANIVLIMSCIAEEHASVDFKGRVYVCAAVVVAARIGWALPYVEEITRQPSGTMRRAGGRQLCPN